MKEKTSYTDILIVDDKGKIAYFDISNLQLLGLRPDEVIGKKVTSLYKDLNESNSTMIKAIKTREATINCEQKLTSYLNNVVHQTSSTFPIMNGKKIIGSIEFAQYYYEKEAIKLIEKHYEHMIYRKNNTTYTIDDIITRNKRMIDIKEKIGRISKTESTVLIQGKTGTGKEMVAQSIHNCSKRRYAPFISQNCGAIPENLLESILFGTTKGSFTGAEDRQGLFEMAQGGTIFLDEINSLSPMLQVKLLKVIEDKRIRRIGSSKEIPLNVRVIAALNENAEELLKKKILREDLYYRLSVVMFKLPDLIERKEDIEYLANFYIDYYNHKLCCNVKHISKDILLSFLNYSWPGNVRELRNVIEGIFNYIDGDKITMDSIPKKILQNDNAIGHKIQWREGYSLKLYLKNYEKGIIMEAYRRNNNSLSETAKQLNISKQLLEYKLNRY